MCLETKNKGHCTRQCKVVGFCAFCTFLACFLCFLCVRICVCAFWQAMACKRPIWHRLVQKHAPPKVLLCNTPLVVPQFACHRSRQIISSYHCLKPHRLDRIRFSQFSLAHPCDVALFKCADCKGFPKIINGNGPFKRILLDNLA